MAIDVDRNLVEGGVKEIKYYYRNCPIVGNIFTVCIFLSEDKKILARGVSICSLMDTHLKQYAREKSKSRAMAAFFKKENSLKIATEWEDKKALFTEVIKSFKIKNEEEANELLKKVGQLQLDYTIKDLDGYQRMDVFIPYLYPIQFTGKNFEYKSMFKPKPTEEEKKMFKLV